MATKPRSKREENALKWRAIAAFVRFTPPGQLHAAPFDDTEASVSDVRGKLYVRLSAGNKQLAVFRVRADGQLKRLRRPPRELRGDGDE
jgi:hypothetical protein